MQSTLNSRLLRMGLAVVMALILGQFWPASAGAAASTWPGTYVVNAPELNSAPTTGTVDSDGAQTLFGSGGWTASHYVITLNSSSPAPLLVCVGAGLLPPCEFVTVATGKHSHAGIGTKKRPGLVTVSMIGSDGSGSIGAGSSPWWAVRTS